MRIRSTQGSRPGLWTDAPSGLKNSGQVPVHLRQEPGEVDPAGAGGAGGVEVGAGPVAGLGGERGVLAAGLGAVAEVLVIGQETEEVAELGPRAGGERAAAVAVGAERRALGEHSVAELEDLRRLQRLETAGRVGV